MELIRKLADFLINLNKKKFEKQRILHLKEKTLYRK